MSGHLQGRHPNSYFVAIEGLDGSGKSEMTRRLCALFQEQLGDALLSTHEPNVNYCAGEFIRNALRKTLSVSDSLLAYAFATNRIDHCERGIGPVLATANSLVITDRYYLSSLAYQTTPALAMDQVMHLNRLALRPDLFLFLDVSDDVCRARIHKRSEPLELFETRLAETRSKYHQAIQFVRGRGDMVTSVNADAEPEQVLRNLRHAIMSHAPQWLTKKLMQTA